MSRSCPFKHIPKNFYNKTLISELCIEGEFYEHNESCEYGEWDWCSFYFKRPGLVVKDDLNHFNVTCQGRKLNQKNGNCLIEENCFCIATGDYEGYFNPDLPILKCKCFAKKSTYVLPISKYENQEKISVEEEKKKCECKGQKTNRRICEICNTFPTKIEGICQLSKEKHRFESTIDCEDPIISAEIDRTLTTSSLSDDYLRYLVKLLAAPDLSSDEPVFSYGHSFKNIESRDQTFRTGIFTVFNNHGAQLAFILVFTIALFVFLEYSYNKLKKLKLKRNNLKEETSKEETSKEETSKEETSEEETLRDDTTEEK